MFSMALDDVMVNQFFVLNTDAAVAVTLQQQFNGVRPYGKPEYGRMDPGTTTLDVTQNGRASFAVWFWLRYFCQLINVTDVLCDSNDCVFYLLAMPALISATQIFTVNSTSGSR